MSSCQMVIGTLASVSVGLLHVETVQPVAAILLALAVLGTAMLWVGERRIGTLYEGDGGASFAAH